MNEHLPYLKGYTTLDNLEAELVDHSIGSKPLHMRSVNSNSPGYYDFVIYVNWEHIRLLTVRLGTADCNSCVEILKKW